MSDGLTRCAWGDADELMRGYHDREWGVPERDGRKLWEKLILDGFQAGLSWRTILARREGFRLAFEGFDPDVVAAYGPREIERLLADPGIIRSRSKIGAAINNAKAYVAMREAGEDFATFCWHFVGGAPLAWEGAVPPNSPLSEQGSKALKKRGFTFVGPTIVFAWMEATGLINTHAPGCFRRAELLGKPLRNKA
ncbi:MAG: DNA-3-methyladenine glycosylase I [Luteibacter sp.]